MKKMTAKEKRKIPVDSDPPPKKSKKKLEDGNNSKQDSVSSNNENGKSSQRRLHSKNLENEFEMDIEESIGNGPNKKETITSNDTTKDNLLKKSKSKSLKSNVKTDWKELKQRKKELKRKRKGNSNLFELISQANIISEKLRQKKLEGGEEERQKLIQKLHGMLKENDYYNKFILKHDSSRIIQYLLKFSKENVRREISKVLAPSAADIMQSKYGRFCIKRMLKYGNPETREEIIKSFYGNVVKLVTHSFSAPIFEYAYTTFATVKEKKLLTQEFFGDMFKQSKDKNIGHLKDVYADRPELKPAILNATKANLLKVLNKDLLDSALVHTVLYQFICECDPKDKEEIVPQLTKHAVILSNSKDGAKLLIACLRSASNKDKKAMVKTINKFVVPMAKHEYGHTAIIGLLDSVDDTVLVNKAILQPLMDNAFEVASNEWGRRVLLWIVAPEDPAHFHPMFTAQIVKGRMDSTSKKDSKVRQTELLNFCIEKLLQQVASAPTNWLSNSSTAYLTLAVLKAGSELNKKILQTAYENIAEALKNKEWKITEEGKEHNPIEHPGLHMILKKLIKLDKNNEHSKYISFAEKLVEVVNKETLKSWIKTNRGCFLLVSVLEDGSENAQKKLRKLLKPLLANIQEQDSKGAECLQKKL